MPKQSEGKRLRQIGLEQELVDRVNDFREANLGSAENKVVGEALEHFMNYWLKKNAGIKEAYDAIRKRRRENS